MNANTLHKPLKKLLAEYLAYRPPPAPFTWLNLYLETIRSKTFSTDNLLHMIVTPEGQEGYGLYVASILDNIYKFGGKHDQYRYHRMWASSNSPLKFFVHQPWSYTSMLSLVNIDFGVGAVEKICTVCPLVNTTHSTMSWLPSPMSLSHIG